MANTEQDKEYLSKTLDYEPSIKDTWKPSNTIGTSEGDLDVVDAPKGTNINPDDTDPFKNEEARYDIILNNSTTDITKGAISSTLYSLSKVKDIFAGSPANYEHTLYIVDHAIKFWTSMYSLAEWFDFSSIDIEQYKSICQTESDVNIALGKAIAVLSKPGSNNEESKELTDAIREYDNNKASLKEVQIDKDAKRTKCFMSSDVNRAIIMYANECSYLCQNIEGAPESELNALTKSAADTFLGLSKDDVKGIGELMSGELVGEIYSLKRVANAGTDEYSINRHINYVKELATYKMSSIPKMKHVMRNNQSKYDFTNMVINDMLVKCSNIDDKYKESLVSTVKYMHAENSILLKTFINETKLNRFKMSSDYINL